MDWEWLYGRFRDSAGISTDTRRLQAGQIFFALRGAQHDGNAFAQQAVERGAVLAVVDDVQLQGDRFVHVPDALQALQHLAAMHRRRLQADFIAIAGSNGKTTTKELMAAVLARRFRVYATPGNRNNHIGVPLSLLEVHDDTEIAVLEIGANHLGETAQLAALIAPQYGLITNNGKDHLEGYGSAEAVKRGNGELYDYMRQHGGLAFVNADDAELMTMSHGLRRYTYGGASTADVQGTLLSTYPTLTLRVGATVLSTQLTGAYNFSNLMAAIGAGRYFGVETEAIAQALKDYVPAMNRSQVVSFAGNTILLDAYNANPSSMEAALQSFFADPRQPKWVILGDMAELGAATAAEHGAVLRLLQQAGPAGACLVGPAFAEADAAGNYLHFADVQALKQWFRDSGLRGHFILVKGSRRQQLERLLEAD